MSLWSWNNHDSRFVIKKITPIFKDHQMQQQQWVDIEKDRHQCSDAQESLNFRTWFETSPYTKDCFIHLTLPVHFFLDVKKNFIEHLCYMPLD